VLQCSVQCVVLQCVAVQCCSVFHCRVLQNVAVRETCDINSKPCSVLQPVAMQRVAACCSVLDLPYILRASQCVAVCRGVSRCVAALQHVAACCSALDL